MYGLNKPSFFLMKSMMEAVRENESYINLPSRLLSNYSFEALSSACDSLYRDLNAG
jgi:hypothetical protein